MTLKIVDLTQVDAGLVAQIARFLPVCFHEFSPDWLPDIEASRSKVIESLSDGRRSRILIDDFRSLPGRGRSHSKRQGHAGASCELLAEDGFLVGRGNAGCGRVGQARHSVCQTSIIE